ncbi:MAG: helix-turn-helix domain-containing protein [Alicyclobacillus sp.]|nr:helix-turn-helix domain-containing protein [Alicyclobacillus sp.]
MTKAEMEQRRKFWRTRVADFRASGLTGAAWCAAHQVKEHQLWYWVGKFKADTAHDSRGRDDVEPHFIPVRVGESEPKVTNKPLSVRMGSAVIEVSPGYDPDLLRDVVRTLASLC